MSRDTDPVSALLGKTMRSIGFLSRLPVPARYFEDEPGTGMREDAGAFPLAGAAIAAGPAVLLVVLSAIGVPPLMAAALAILVLVAVTGALHEDGLGDVADGFGGGGTPERRLDIMKDSRIGTYGAVAIAGSLVLRVGGVAALLGGEGPIAAGLAVIAAAAASRGAIVWFWNSLPNARGDGVAHDAGAPSQSAVRVAAAAGLAIFAVLGIATAGVANTAMALLFALAALRGFGALCKRMIGGLTGDTLGAAQQIAEVMLLTGLVLGISNPT